MYMASYERPGITGVRSQVWQRRQPWDEAGRAAGGRWWPVGAVFTVFFFTVEAAALAAATVPVPAAVPGAAGPAAPGRLQLAQLQPLAHAEPLDQLQPPPQPVAFQVCNVICIQLYV